MKKDSVDNLAKGELYRIRMFSLFHLLTTFAVVSLQLHANPCTASDLEAEYNQTMLWGTYRPNLYFGTRTRTPQSLLSGLAWFSLDRQDGLNNLRHGCDIGDKLEGYIWNSHNGRDFGSQTIKDGLSNVELSTAFVKSDDGKSWAVRIRGESLRGTNPSSISLLYYFAQEGGHVEGAINSVGQKRGNSKRPQITFSGTSKSIGEYRVDVRLAKGKTPRVTPSFEALVPNATEFQAVSLNVNVGDEWKAKEFIVDAIKRSSEAKIRRLNLRESGSTFPTPAQILLLESQESSSANFIIVQKQLTTPFVLDISLLSLSGERGDVKEGTLAGKALSQLIKLRQQTFDEQFERVFKLQGKGFDSAKIEFGKAVFSNLIGGVGYFSGQWIVDRAPYSSEAEEAEEDDDLLDPVLAENAGDGEEELLDDDDYEVQQLAKSKHRAEIRKKDIQTVGPDSLFTAVPSRPFFPRGFLWDEGFHQVLIGQFDNDVSLDIIKHWFNLLDSDGWLAREQILGDEARSRVPSEFQVQYPHHANPPTLLLPIFSYMQRIVAKNSFDNSSSGGIYLSSKSKAISYLEHIYPKLKLRFEWLKETQAGDFVRYRRRLAVPVGFRWRGRVGIHTLSSGLDDYPRAFPASVGELHLDLISWLAWYASGLRSVSAFLLENAELLSFLNEKQLAADGDEFESDASEMKEAITENHWSEDDKLFCDIAGVGVYGRTEFECHAGYVSLFPFILQLLDKDDAKIASTLDIIEDPDELWTDFGLRSLSKKDPFYGKDENYWRGPIWLNINYLVCKALYLYKAEGSRYSERLGTIYESLRSNLINNLFKQYQSTGYVWEQYSPINGQGLRSHPFTGWTSLVVALMAENY